MRRRGLTILELLLALVLLASLTGLLSTWVVTASRLSASSGPRIEWRSAAQRVLLLIEDDVACGDFTGAPGAEASRTRVTRVDASSLRIATRSATAVHPAAIGASLHEYRYDALRGTLELVVSAAGGAGRGQTRPLLDQIVGWRVVVDAEACLLTVEIESGFGDKAAGRFRWR